MKVINLGEIKITKEGFELPIVADCDGLWEFITNFNGSYQYVQFEQKKGENIFCTAFLLEYYTYSFKLYKPDTSLLNDTIYQMTTKPNNHD